MSSSYLLLIDGSPQSSVAARVCRRLAEKNGADVTALYVIDTSSVRNLLPMGRPGLIGSGPYVAAYHQILSALSEVAETVMQAYTSKFSAPSATQKCLIKQGDPLEVIREFYTSCDVIIMGHAEGESLAQAIAEDGVAPVLSVGEDETCQCLDLKTAAVLRAPLDYAQAV